MILAIELCHADGIDNEGNPSVNKIVYIEKVAVFEHEKDAIEFANRRSDIALVDLSSGDVIKCGNLEIEK